LDDTTHLQQDRGGGKIRVVGGDERRTLFTVDHRGTRVAVELHDAKMYDGKLYAVVSKDKEIYTAWCDDWHAGKLHLRLRSKVAFQGAKDTGHAILFDGRRWSIFGRLRAADWDTDNPVLKDRRGIRRLLSETFDGPYTSHVYRDPAETQPAYAGAAIRYDYYATRATLIDGIEVLGISCFAKNASRRPSTRADRITGTGPIYPVFAVDGRILSHTNTIVPLQRHVRRTSWKEAQPYEPEVGQVYCCGITYNQETRTVSVYYNHRQDTHYLVDAETSKTLPNCVVYRIQARR